VRPTELVPARFNKPNRLLMDERRCLLVSESEQVDTLRVVEASLMPQLWMGPVNATTLA
jgi:hypothetical protein